jgi:hypothetical protein
LISRFLKARSGDVKKALSAVKEDLEWREQNSIHLVRSQTSMEVLNAIDFPIHKQRHDEIFRHGFLGYDKQGRPIVYKWYNKNYVIPFVEGLDCATLTRYNTWMVERLSGN